MQSSGIDTTPKYIHTPDNCMSPSAYGDSESAVWLNGAISLDAVLMKTAPEVKDIADKLFDHLILQIEADGIIKNTKAKKTLTKIKTTCKILLLNLYTAYLFGVPVRYSRDKKWYKKSNRYGRIFFSYSRIIACTKAFHKLGLIDQKRGVRNRKTNTGRQTRMWATPLLIQLFHKIKIHQPARVAPDDPKELIVLRDDEKNTIEYPETKQTLKWRANLLSYNDFITKQVVTVRAEGFVKVSLNNLASKIYSKFISGELSLVNLQVNKYKYLTENVTSRERVIENQVTDTSSKGYMTQSYFDFTSINDNLNETFSVLNPGEKYTSTATGSPAKEPMFLPLLSVILRKYLHYCHNNPNWKKARVPLLNFGIHQLDFTVNSKKLHRVFNRKSWELGGRFYGGYQTLPKKMRRAIFINDEPTVELDYTAHHVRMAYHLEGIDYKDDPYLAITNDPAEREVFKLLLLVEMNAKDEDKALGGFRNKNRDKLMSLLGDLKNTTLKPLMQRVVAAHPEIEKYIHNDVGVRLQYLDSQITEAILLNMTKQDIPCLPIHDSYIVPAQHEAELLSAMMVEYKRLMKFDPIVG